MFHPIATEYTFFLTAYGTFSKIYNILVFKASLKKYKKIEIIFYILSDHHGLKLATTKETTEIFKYMENEQCTLE
jgi:hypothetical protein